MPRSVLDKLGYPNSLFQGERYRSICSGTDFGSQLIIAKARKSSLARFLKHATFIQKGSLSQIARFEKNISLLNDISLVLTRTWN